MLRENTGSPQPANDLIERLQSKIRDLEAVLNQNNLHIALAFQLTPAQANVLGLLLSLPVVTTDAIQYRLELAADPKLAIHRLRATLKAWHQQFDVTDSDGIVQGKRNVGYWIAPEVKKKLLAYVAERTSLPAEVTEAA